MLERREEQRKDIPKSLPFMVKTNGCYSSCSARRDEPAKKEWRKRKGSGSGAIDERVSGDVLGLNKYELSFFFWELKRVKASQCIIIVI